jgi:catechol-2,3-dioxygenase
MLLQNYYNSVLKLETFMDLESVSFLMCGIETTGEYHAHLIVWKKIETSENKKDIHNFVREE